MTISSDQISQNEIVETTSGQVIIVKRYTSKRLEQEQAARIAAMREMRERLMRDHVKRGRRRGGELHALRLVCGMLTSDDPAMREAGRELAEVAGIERSRRFAERHTPEQMRQSVKRLIADVRDPKGAWSKVIARTKPMPQTSRWN